MAKAPKNRPRKPRAAPPNSAPERQLAEARDLCRKLISQLDEKMEQLGLVNGVLRTIVGGLSLPEILKVFASNLKTICPFDRCSISLYDPARRVFHIPFMINGGQVVPTKEAPLPAAATILSKVLETRRPVLRKNIQEEAQYKTDRGFTKKGFGCEMIFPLAIGANAFGTLNVCCYEPGRLIERHLLLLQDIVPAISVAVSQYYDREKFIFV